MGFRLFVKHQRVVTFSTCIRRRVECSAADSQNFARKLNREGVKLYG